MAEESDLARELDATVAARRQLGKDYEPALVASFLEKVDREVDARVDARIAATRSERYADRRPARRSGGSVVALGSVTLGIPITAIVTTQLHGIDGLLGVVVAWGGIAAVNLAHSIGRRRP